MRAKQPFAELAERVAADLGSFNAVHLRRGDFKVTYGVTTLDRQPCGGHRGARPGLRPRGSTGHRHRRARRPFLPRDRRSPIRITVSSTGTSSTHYGADFAQLPQTRQPEPGPSLPTGRRRVEELHRHDDQHLHGAHPALPRQSRPATSPSASCGTSYPRPGAAPSAAVTRSATVSRSIAAS